MGFSQAPRFASITASSTTTPLIIWHLSSQTEGRHPEDCELLRTQSRSYPPLSSQHLAHQHQPHHVWLHRTCTVQSRGNHSPQWLKYQVFPRHPAGALDTPDMQMYRLTDEWPSEQPELTFQCQNWHPMGHQDAISEAHTHKASF